MKRRVSSTRGSRCVNSRFNSMHNWSRWRRLVLRWMYGRYRITLRWMQSMLSMKKLGHDHIILSIGEIRIWVKLDRFNGKPRLRNRWQSRRLRTKRRWGYRSQFFRTLSGGVTCSSHRTTSSNRRKSRSVRQSNRVSEILNLTQSSKTSVDMMIGYTLNVTTKTGGTSLEDGESMKVGVGKW